MATADEYAAWIVANQSKKGTPEFDTVAKAYQEAKAETPRAAIEAPAFEREAAETLANPPASYLLARDLGLTGRYGLEGVGAGVIANKLGLPAPANPRERIAGDVARTMAGTAGIGSLAGKVAPMLKGIPEVLAKAFAANPGAQVVSSAGAGASGGLAREGGYGPAGEAAASLAGGVAGPTAIGAGRWAGGHIANMGATVGASFGNPSGIERTARAAAQRIAGTDRGRIQGALSGATEYAPGVKPTVAEAIAEAQMGKPEQFGGATIKLQKELSGAAGIEDIVPSAVRKQNVAMGEHIANVKAESAPMREGAFQGVNVTSGLVPADDIIANLDAQISKPGTRASALVQKTMGAVKEKIQALAAGGGGVDVRDLYTVRKEIGNTISQYAKETANWDKRLAAGIEKDVQRYIDDAIEAAGGVGWGDYLKNYSMGMKAAENQVMRAGEAKRIAAGVKSSNAQNLAAGEIPKPPTLLSRPMMATNWALKLLSRDANTPVARRVARAMTDPDDYARLLSAPATDPARVLLERTMQQAILATGVNQVTNPRGILSEQ